jgi:hypothetical protein
MKPLPLLVAAALVAGLLVSPLALGAGSITFSSPASGASYKGTQSYSITGQVTPTPSQPDSVFISVKNPSGVTVDAADVAVAATTGTFTYSTATGGSGNWISGTYTITATDSFSTTGSTTFAYTSPTSAPPYNETKALVDIMGNLTIIQQEIKNLNNDLHGNVTAIQATQTTQGTAISGLTSSLASITSTLTGVQSSLTSLTTSVSGLVTTVGNINTAVSGMSSQISTAATNALNASNAVSSTQTYVLVVAVLAAITLVLELAILVRKIS